MFLVTLCGSMDDLPVFAGTQRQVEQFLRTHRPFPVDGQGCEQEGPLAQACKAFGRGPSFVFGFQITQFDSFGVPAKVFKNQWFQGDWPTRDELESLGRRERTRFESELEYDSPFTQSPPV